MDDTWEAIVSDTIDSLVFEQECGVRTLPIDGATLAALASPPAPRVDALIPSPPTRAVAPAARRTTALPATPHERQEEVARIAAAARLCTRCPLAAARTGGVPGQGCTLDPEVLFVGGAPDAEDDRQGVAFSGPAGELLTRMITAMGLSRETVFITHICKCPSPGRPPAAAELQACLPFLEEQVDAIRPRTIVALGQEASVALRSARGGAGGLRGTWSTFRNIPLLYTFHPAELLSFPTSKRPAWEHLQSVLRKLGRTPPPAPRPAATPS